MEEEPEIPFPVRFNIFKHHRNYIIYIFKSFFKGSNEFPTLEKVNQIRTQIGFSPVRKLDRNRGILKCYETFYGL